jgi:aspartate carbamoyltransferase regulatory subunit
MKIDSIKNGIVLDHITAGKSLEVYKALGLDKLDCSVAIIKNVKSNKMGKKDILKIDEEFALDFDVLGYLDPNITVCIIKDGKLVEKKKLQLPQKIINDILKGVSGDYEVINDRHLAIAKGMSLLKENDILMILGKGHEDYQIIGTEKIHFSDQEEVEKYIREHIHD